MADTRVAREGDADAIAALGPPGSWTPESIRAQVLVGASLVAIEGGEVAGFIAVRPGHLFGRDFIESLVVGPRWRRRGIGRDLIRAALRDAATSRVFISTNESNMPMRELLLRDGWLPAGILTGLDEDDPEHFFFHDVPAPVA